MLSDTLAAGLESYRIGDKIRALRLKKKLGLVQLGEHTGLSPGMLSKIERGQMFPTLPTLLRIALVFGVGLEHFFVEGRPKFAVIRKEERLALPEGGEKEPSYFFESLNFPVTDRAMDAYYAAFPSGAPASPAHRHEGAELIFVISGTLVVIVEGDEIVLGPGDAMHFESNVPHAYRQAGKAPASAIVVTAPG